jgi:hypothetical protein
MVDRRSPRRKAGIAHLSFSVLFTSLIVASVLYLLDTAGLLPIATDAEARRPMSGVVVVVRDCLILIRRERAEVAKKARENNESFIMERYPRD